MAQIIKHRRGSISSLASVTANVGELVMATGSIGDLTAPVIFIGDSAVAGGYKPVSKIYQGTAAPDLTSNNWGTTMNGTPFYASGNKSLNILNNAGNTKMDLTGNIEGNTIVGVTITSLTGSNGNFSNLTGTTFTSTNGNITSLTGSNANVTNITGSTISGSNVRVTSDMSVGGKVVVDGDISGSNLNLTGNATIDGNIVLKGNISIGDQTTDLVTFGADVSSSILPDVHNAFDLGSSEKNWRNLHVSGTAYVNQLNLNSIQLTNLDLPGYLNVTGATTLGGTTIVNADFTANGSNSTLTANYGGNNIELVTYNGATIDLNGPTTINGNTVLTGSVKVTGSIYNDQLTDNRVLIAGPNGRIEDSQYFTYDEVTLKVGTGTGNFEVGVSGGDIRTSGSLLVKSGTTITGSLNVTGSVNLKGNTTITGSLEGQDSNSNWSIVGNGFGETYIQSTTGNMMLRATTGEVTVKTGNFRVETNAKVDGTLQVSGSTSLTGSLIVSNSVDIKGDTKMTGSLNVTNIKGTGSVYLQPNQADARYFEIYNTAASDVHIKSSNGLSFFGDDTNYLKIDDNAQTVTIVGVNGVSVSSSLNVTGSASFTNNLNVSGSASVTGAFTVGSGSITSLGGDLYVSGNLQVLGSSTSVNIQSQTVELDDNIIRLNAYSPFLRYAGFEVMDSGSSGVSSSMLWDSQNDYWLLTNQNGSGSKFIGTTFGAQGSEISLTSGTIPKATSANTVEDSLLTENGTTLSYNTNKFQVTASNGATLIAGNVTVSAGGGADAGTKTSAVVFRNSSNVLGYVSTTESTDVLDGILGYKNADGALKFSTVIDGGTY
jgi:cytoskeletal protein CcmA (bactofilin family)